MNAKEIYQKMNGDEKLTVKKSAQRLGEISAFAETFMKSINPEAVEDMRNALEGLLREISYGNGNVFSEITAKLNHKTTRQLQRLCKEAKSALEKSKL